MSINAGLKSFLFSEVLANDFASELTRMLNNHPDDPKYAKSEITIRLKSGDGENEYITKNIVGFIREECGCDKIESKIRKIMTLDGYGNITAEVKKTGIAQYLALVNF